MNRKLYTKKALVYIGRTCRRSILCGILLCYKSLFVPWSIFYTSCGVNTALQILVPVCSSNLSANATSRCCNAWVITWPGTLTWSSPKKLSLRWGLRNHKAFKNHGGNCICDDSTTLPALCTIGPFTF
jgi:hypothetical protein